MSLSDNGLPPDSAMIANPRVLIASPVFPYPSHSGNSARVAHLHQALVDLGCEVGFVFCPVSCIQPRGPRNQTEQAFAEHFFEISEGFADDHVHQRLLSRIKRMLGRHCPIALNDYVFLDGFVRKRGVRQFKSVIEKFRPDLVIVEYVVLSGLVEDLGFRGLCLIDTHDVFSNRNQRMREIGSSSLWWSLNPRQERAALQRFDVVIAIQEHEESVFKHLLGRCDTIVETLDILQLPDGADTVSPRLNTAPALGFFASRNGHNLEGIEVFLREHWKSVRERVPSVRLVLAGSLSMDPCFAKHPGVDVIGILDNPADFYQRVDLVINPCPSGTGLKIKSVEALTFGKPLVTTPEGAAGLETFGLEAMFCHPLADPSFADACVKLLADPSLCSQLGSSASAILADRAQHVRERLWYLLKKSKTLVNGTDLAEMNVNNNI